MKIQKSIVALANELLKEPEKFCSWGAEKIKIEENTMSFSVSGFKFCGIIWIIILTSVSVLCSGYAKSSY